MQTAFFRILFPASVRSGDNLIEIIIYFYGFVLSEVELVE